MKKNKVVPGKFYLVYDDESEEYAIASHSSGFSNVKAAILEANSSGATPISFRVINSNKETVHQGITKHPFLQEES